MHLTQCNKLYINYSALTINYFNAVLEITFVNCCLERKAVMHGLSATARAIDYVAEEQLLASTGKDDK